MRLTRVLIVLVALGGIAPPALQTLLPPLSAGLAAQDPSRPPPQDEFVPIDQLPPQEELPAAPLVVAAYSFVWIAFVAYCFSLVKRVRKVEADLAALERGRR